jgi:hypothetical protein
MMSRMLPIVVGAQARGILAAIFAAGSDDACCSSNAWTAGKILISGETLQTSFRTARRGAVRRPTHPNSLRDPAGPAPGGQKRFFEEVESSREREETGKLPRLNSARAVRDVLFAPARRRGVDVRFGGAPHWTRSG